MRKILLAIAITLTIFMMFLAVNTDPEVILFMAKGYKVGFNITTNWLLKLTIIGTWGLFFWKTIKEEENG
jgi:hypothetical protein